MATLARLQTSSCSNPVLDIWTQVNGVLTNVFSLEFQIFDLTSGSAVQVYPATPGQRATAVVDSDCPAGHRLSTGRYVALWTVPSSATVGKHQIRWFFKLTSASPEQLFNEDFDVVAEVTASSNDEFSYALVSDLRDEGVPSNATFTDAWVQQRISLASRFIERATGRFFAPRAMTLTIDGRGGPTLLLGHPIVSIESVSFETSPFRPSSTAIDADLMRVYNRHLTQGLLFPDDRDNPKVELYHPSYDIMTSTPYQFSRLIFPEGNQNVTVKGVFGYTDPDGTPTGPGKTPDLIKHVCKLIVLREIEKLNSSSRTDAVNRYRLLSERTRDQAYTLGPLGSGRTGGLFTGDPDIDHVLASYMRPPDMGAA